MPERKSTGGAKEFAYSNEDLKRIRSTDTSSTKAFKEGYRRWQEQRAVERIEEEKFRKQRRNMALLLILLFVMLVVLVFLRVRS
jgi:hypothetical protein